MFDRMRYMVYPATLFMLLALSGLWEVPLNAYPAEAQLKLAQFNRRGRRPGDRQMRKMAERRFEELCQYLELTEEQKKQARGYFDDRHIKKVVPKLAYPYGHANAYGQKVSQQLPYVIQQLIDYPDTRRAVLHIGKAEDGQEHTKPCMQTVQFQIRNGKLHTTVFARSWDVLSGLPYDSILMQGVCQIMAKLLGRSVEPGPVTFMASSLHVYSDAWDRHDIRPGTYKIPWNSVEIVRDFEDFDDVRNWAHDELNSIDEWEDYLPEGVVSYYVE